MKPLKIKKYTVIESAAMKLADQKKGIELLFKFGDEKVRLMSFAMTVEQMRARRKTVTRRHTAKHVAEGDLILAVEKARGVRVADRVSIAVIRVLSVRRETLGMITPAECILEGFPELSPREFVQLYLKGNGISPRVPLTEIETTRIEFKFEMML